MTPDARSAPHATAVLGLGEAGTEIAVGLVAAGAIVRGFDPNPSAFPLGVEERTSEADAVHDADMVISLTSAANAEAALQASILSLRPGTLWVEANTAAPALKSRLSELASTAGADLVDAAIMAPVAGLGLGVPMAVSGSAAMRFISAMANFGVSVEHVAGPVGSASSRKLLRSIVVKGLTAALIEATAGARAAGCEDWLGQHLATELFPLEYATVERLILGSYRHAARRADEMDAAAQQLRDLAVTNNIAVATADLLRGVAADAPTFSRGSRDGESEAK
ncbi:MULTISPECIES: NAD(P)-dependent oxidoreductase [unclassified Mycolicibacterium]|uniref:NAD(P)-dependent oxidoreductase n=1 Tax=unclassified Mycolicibacterium TaxID=2636767 RepID=UPI002ED7DA0F